MPRYTSGLVKLIAGMLLCCGLIASVAAQQQPVARYRLITPQPFATGDRIEVIEFFWYGCPYCYELEPVLDAWLKRKPADVVLRRIPAVFKPSWVPHARIYYTLEALGAVERLHRAAYHDYHIDDLAMDNDEAMANWAARNGLDRSAWLAAYNSEQVARNIELARELTARYEIRGTPSLVVDGYYLTSSGMTPGVPAMIPVLEELIARARERRKTK